MKRVPVIFAERRELERSHFAVGTDTHAHVERPEVPLVIEQLLEQPMPVARADGARKVTDAREPRRRPLERFGSELEDRARRAQNLDAPHARRRLPSGAQKRAQADESQVEPLEALADFGLGRELAEDGATKKNDRGVARRLSDRASQIGLRHGIGAPADAYAERSLDERVEVEILLEAASVPRRRRQRGVGQRRVEDFDRAPTGEREDERLPQWRHVDPHRRGLGQEIRNRDRARVVCRSLGFDERARHGSS